MRTAGRKSDEKWVLLSSSLCSVYVWSNQRRFLEKKKKKEKEKKKPSAHMLIDPFSLRCLLFVYIHIHVSCRIEKREQGRRAYDTTVRFLFSVSL